MSEQPTTISAFRQSLRVKLALDRLKKRKNKQKSAVFVELTKELEEALPGSSDDQILDAREIGRMLTSFAEGLSYEDRWLFVHRYVYLEQVKEIAKSCGIKENTVKSRLFTIRKRLKRFLESEGIIV